MKLQDYIGKRGERIFSVLITRWCGGGPWFDDVHLGEKYEAKDFLVNLIEPDTGDACFYVQVKATTTGYTGAGANRKLNVQVTKEDVEKLKKVPAPAYVVGIDIDKECGFIIGITQASTGGLSGISTRHRLNCRTIKALWNEVNEYWRARKMLTRSSRFS